MYDIDRIAEPREAEVVRCSGGTPRSCRSRPEQNAAPGAGEHDDPAVVVARRPRRAPRRAPATSGNDIELSRSGLFSVMTLTCGRTLRSTMTSAMARTVSARSSRSGRTLPPAAPVLAALAIEHALVDEIAAERRGVGMHLGEDEVHHVLRVATAGLEPLRPASRARRGACRARRDRHAADRRGRTPAAPGRVFGCVGVLRRARRTRSTSARAASANASPSKWCVPSSPRTTRPVSTVAATPWQTRARVEPAARPDLARVGRAEHERREHPAPVLVGEQAHELAGLEQAMSVTRR